MTPATVIDSFVPETSMYGPAGISVVVIVPVGTFAGIVVVLICSWRLPARVSGPAVRLALSASAPATPPPASSSDPLEIDTLPKPPSGIVALVTVTSTTVLAPMVVSWKLKLPVSVWPRKLSAMLFPVTLTWELVLVVVTDSPSVPTSVTPGMETDTLAFRFPVRPPLVPNVSVPLPPETVSSALAPSPNEALTLLAATLTVPLWSVTEKLPLRLWPAIVSCTPVPVTWKYGPAGSVKLALVPPTWNCCETAALVVFTCTAKVPVKTDPDGRPLKVTVPANWPATPPPVDSSSPLPFVIETPTLGVPSVTLRLLMAISTSGVGADPAGACELTGKVACWKPKLPEIDWPATVTEPAPVAVTESGAIVSAPTVWAALVVLIVRLTLVIETFETPVRFTVTEAPVISP